MLTRGTKRGIITDIDRKSESIQINFRSFFVRIWLFTIVYFDAQFTPFFIYNWLDVRCFLFVVKSFQMKFLINMVHQKLANFLPKW